MQQSNPILTLRSVTKRYGNALALDSVDFTLGRGEIHAVLGENGAGKSTLMHVMRGLTQPDAGRIEIDGRPVVLSSPEAARRQGVGMVHQHFMLVPSFTVAENLALAAETSSLRLSAVLDAVSEKAAGIAHRLGWSLSLNTRVGDLPVGAQQRVEIIRALMGGVSLSSDSGKDEQHETSILLFDEPTAVLAPTETVELFQVLRSLREEGRSLVFVSHKLNEVMDLCDRVTVLRRGRVVGTLPITETDPHDLAARMVGPTNAPAVVDTAAAATPTTDAIESVSAPAIRRPSNAGRTVLSLRDLSTEPRRYETALRGMTFDLHAGEILGFAGVDGNGQTELSEVLSGLRRWSSGRVEVDGRELARIQTSKLHDLGIAVIPPDRHREGLALDLSVEENLMLQAIDMPEHRFGPFVRRKKLREYAGRLARDFDIRARDIRLPARALSGGNQQKIVAARALAREPKLLIAVSPTRGLDVAAAAYIHDQLRRRRDEGGAIILISTELDEVIELSDRIAVLSRGAIVDIVPPETPRTSLGLMMA